MSCFKSCCHFKFTWIPGTSQLPMARPFTPPGRSEDISNTDGNSTAIVEESGSSQPPLARPFTPPNEEEVEQEESVRRATTETIEDETVERKRRSGVVPLPVRFDENAQDTLPKYPKTEEEEKMIKEAFEKNDFLSKFVTGKRLQDVIDAMYKKDVEYREVLIKEGQKGSQLYVSAEGKFQITIKKRVVGEINVCQVFGELAILYTAKRLATITALTKGSVWVLDSTIFHKLMVGSDIKEQNETLEFLKNVESFKDVKDEILRSVASLLKSEFFTTDKVIVRQGDKGDKFYIIRAGTVTIAKDGEGVVAKFRKGQHFGELALQKEDYRQATVTADPPLVECLTLTRQQFIDHFGDVEIPMINVPRYSEQPFEAVVQHSDVEITDLKIIKTLGVGGFGRVELVQHRKDEKRIFALKYIKKIDIVQQQQQEHVFNEKRIQMACDSQFIVRLYRTYKDDKYVFFLMESCLGGDLWNLLQKQKGRRFEEKHARFIAACVIEAFEYLHTKGIVYRDLKPENLLIDKNGYVKITDFGFAKKLDSRGKTHTFAGTPEYVAPEIVQNRGHDRAVDYWAYGVFVYELLVGKTPFRSNDVNHLKTYNKILSGIASVQFPSVVPPKARNLIEKLCKSVPSERLGMQRQGVKDIKGHIWFVGFDWVQLQNGEYPVPHKPKLSGLLDTKHFDDFGIDREDPPSEMSGWEKDF